MKGYCSGCNQYVEIDLPPDEHTVLVYCGRIEVCGPVETDGERDYYDE